MNVGFSELILILLIAFLVVGPKDLPKVARWLGRNVKKIKLMIRELKKESGWDDLEKEYNDAKSTVTTEVNTIKKEADVTSDLREASSELKKNIDDVGKVIHRESHEAEKIIKKPSSKS